MSDHEASAVEWRDIPGYEGLYQVSSDGQVKSQRKLLKLQFSPSGYVIAYLSVSGRKLSCYVHRLVAIAFLPNESHLEIVNHIDGNKHNNVVTNLEWCTRTQNAQHARSIGLLDNSGHRNGNAKLTEDQVWQIRVIAAHCLDTFPGGQRGLAKHLGVSESVIHGIIAGKTWKHVEADV